MVITERLVFLFDHRRRLPMVNDSKTKPIRHRLNTVRVNTIQIIITIITAATQVHRRNQFDRLVH